MGSRIPIDRDGKQQVDLVDIGEDELFDNLSNCEDDLIPSVRGGSYRNTIIDDKVDHVLEGSSHEPTKNMKTSLTTLPY